MEKNICEGLAHGGGDLCWWAVGLAYAFAVAIYIHTVTSYLLSAAAHVQLRAAGTDREKIASGKEKEFISQDGRRTVIGRLWHEEAFASIW